MIGNNSNKTINDKSKSSAYKHVPHREKPPHLVARRNARERRRVQAVNLAFIRLRKALPIESRGKRVSKVKTLKKSMEYISHLASLIAAANSNNNNNQVDPINLPRPQPGSAALVADAVSPSASLTSDPTTVTSSSSCTSFSFLEEVPNSNDCRCDRDRGQQFLDFDEGSLTEDEDSAEEEEEEEEEGNYLSERNIRPVIGGDSLTQTSANTATTIANSNNQDAFVLANNINNGYQHQQHHHHHRSLVQGGSFGGQGQTHQHTVMSSMVADGGGHLRHQHQQGQGDGLIVGNKENLRIDGLHEDECLADDGQFTYLGMTMISAGSLATNGRFYDGFAEAMDDF